MDTGESPAPGSETGEKNPGDQDPTADKAAPADSIAPADSSAPAQVKVAAPQIADIFTSQKAKIETRGF